MPLSRTENTPFAELTSNTESLSERFLRQLARLSPPFHMRGWRHIRLFILVSIDVLILSAAYVGAFILRFDGHISSDYWLVLRKTMPIELGISLLIFLVGGMYRQVWKFANLSNAILIGKCVFVGILFTFVIDLAIFERPNLPRTVPIIFWFLATTGIVGVRFSWRAWVNFQASIKPHTSGKRALIYGAGSGGDLLSRHIASSRQFPYQIIGFIDDDKNKVNRNIHNIRILGTGVNLGELCRTHRVEAVLIAMPSASGTIIREIISRCQEAGVEYLMMPTLESSLDRDIIKPRPINIHDLLRRSPKSIDHVKVREFFHSRSVLVTGAGGSIGSEICRQIAQCEPQRIVLFDSSEYNLYTIARELRDKHGSSIELVPLLASVTDEVAVNSSMQRYRPSVVLHAAAYKHVPLVEANPARAITNNVLGTKVLVKCAMANEVERFLLISTDKAVRPTSVMGASKRCCELLVQAMFDIRASHSIGDFCVVRFGNVLGSSGSVVPQFIEQLRCGGPLTVTHPEMTRYFMLISEAVGLVLQSITVSTGGETFVLNMGEPVRIYDMAKQLVLLAGKQPHKDIEIKFTGIRPGEKLYEELLITGRERHALKDDVFVVESSPPDPAKILAGIEELVHLAQRGDESEAIRLLWDLVSEGDKNVAAVAESTAIPTDLLLN